MQWIYIIQTTSKGQVGIDIKVERRGGVFLVMAVECRCADHGCVVGTKEKGRDGEWNPQSDEARFCEGKNSARAGPTVPGAFPGPRFTRETASLTKQ